MGRNSDKGRGRQGQAGAENREKDHGEMKMIDTGVRDSVKGRGGDKDKDMGRERVRDNGNERSEDMGGQEQSIGWEREIGRGHAEGEEAAGCQVLLMDRLTD